MNTIMDIRSEGKIKGVIYKGNYYARISFFDSEFNEEVHQWYIRNPMDTLTRIRDLGMIVLLNDAYNKNI